MFITTCVSLKLEHEVTGANHFRKNEKKKIVHPRESGKIFFVFLFNTSRSSRFFSPFLPATQKLPKKKKNKHVDRILLSGIGPFHCCFIRRCAEISLCMVFLSLCSFLSLFSENAMDDDSRHCSGGGFCNRIQQCLHGSDSIFFGIEYGELRQCTRV